MSINVAQPQWKALKPYTDARSQTQNRCGLEIIAVLAYADEPISTADVCYLLDVGDPSYIRYQIRGLADEGLVTQHDRPGKSSQYTLNKPDQHPRRHSHD